MIDTLHHKMVFTVQSAFFFLGAMPLLLIPQQFISFMGLSMASGGIGVARLYGATLIMLGIIAWAAREAGPSAARRALVLGFFIGNLLAAVVGAFNVLAGGFPVEMWLAVVAWLLLALDFGMLYFKHPDDA